MADTRHPERPLANGKTRIDFQTEPGRYRHWKLNVDGEIATLLLDVDEKAPLFEGYELKLNSYDLGVDIELADALERLRFEHPQVRVLVLRSGKPRVFCAGANIRMLAGASHAHKVNFCKFTNETRNGIEDLSAHSGVPSICAISGTAAGGGYELALAADHIMLVDDGSSAVALPELPLLAVLPGTGGLTRVADKRKVRRDHADVFCTTEEGVKGKRAVEWRLVDEVVPGSKFDDTVVARGSEFAAKSRRNGAEQGIKLTPLARDFTADGIDVRRACGRVRSRRPDCDNHRARADRTAAAIGARTWLRSARRSGRCSSPASSMMRFFNIRLNELDVAAIVFKSSGDLAEVMALREACSTPIAITGWCARSAHCGSGCSSASIVTSRSLVTLIEPGSCFAGTLAELAFASDRSYMLLGQREGDNKPPAAIVLGAANFGLYPMANGLTRLASRFLANPAAIDAAKSECEKPLDAASAQNLGLITFALDDIDWDDEVRVFLEERASFSPDSLTGMEANLRFAGPETMESKIFARLTAWQNWIFQRPNAIGEEGALKRYGTGQQPVFDTKRV